MSYPQQFERCIRCVDMALDGVRYMDTETKDEELRPYRFCHSYVNTLKEALSFEAVQLRIDIIDKIIRHCLTL